MGGHGREKIKMDYSKAVLMYMSNKGEMIKLSNAKMDGVLNLSSMLFIGKTVSGKDISVQLPTTGSLKGYMIGLDAKGGRNSQQQILGAVDKLLKKETPIGLMWEELSAGKAHEQESQKSIVATAEKVGFVSPTKRTRAIDIKTFIAEQSKIKVVEPVKATATKTGKKVKQEVNA